MEDLGVADAHWRFLEVFSCSALPEFFSDPVVSDLKENPPMLLFRFCSLVAVACVFWSRAEIWLLLSAGVGALQ